MMDASMDPTRAAAAGRALVKGAKARHGVATGLRVPMVTGVAALAGKRSVSEFAGPRGGQLGSGESKEGGPEDKAEQMIQSKSDGTDADDVSPPPSHPALHLSPYLLNPLSCSLTLALSHDAPSHHARRTESRRNSEASTVAADVASSR